MADGSSVADSPALGRTTTGSEVASRFRNQVVGRHIVITGVSPNSLGEATAIALAAQNPGLLILASRTISKLEAVATAIRGRFPEVKLSTVILDLASPDSVRDAAGRISQTTDHLDILINNAGVSLGFRRRSPTGLELTFATNHVGPFLLTELLLPLLKRAARDQPAQGMTRIVNLSSAAHYVTPFRFSDYNFDGGRPLPPDEEPRKGLDEHFYEVHDGFAGWLAYSSSKTANVLFTVALRERLRPSGIEVFAVDPGTILTNLVDNIAPGAAAALVNLLREHIKTPDQGCATTIVAAFDSSIAGTDALYLADCRKARPARHAVDKAKAERLWTLTEGLVGQTGRSKI